MMIGSRFMKLLIYIYFEVKRDAEASLRDSERK